MRERKGHEGRLFLGPKLSEKHGESIEFIGARYRNQSNHLKLSKERLRLLVETLGIPPLGWVGQLKQGRSIFALDGRDHSLESSIRRGGIAPGVFPPGRFGVQTLIDLQACRRPDGPSLGLKRQRQIREMTLLGHRRAVAQAEQPDHRNAPTQNAERVDD